MKLTFHGDAGHEWLQVPFELYHRLDFQATQYSYFSRDMDSFFLEGDCDAEAFINILEREKIEFEIVHKEHKGSCFIRKLPRVNVIRTPTWKKEIK